MPCKSVCRGSYMHGCVFIFVLLRYISWWGSKFVDYVLFCFRNVLTADRRAAMAESGVSFDQMGPLPSTEDPSLAYAVLRGVPNTPSGSAILGKVVRIGTPSRVQLRFHDGALCVFIGYQSVDDAQYAIIYGEILKLTEGVPVCCVFANSRL